MYNIEEDNNDNNVNWGDSNKNLNDEKNIYMNTDNINDNHNFPKENNEEENKSEPKKKSNFLNIEYWNKLYDVNEYDIKVRLLSLKNPYSLELSNIINEKVDLYGPFWLSCTLIFVLFAFGNLSGYFSSNTYFYYNYNLIGSACGLVWGYSIFIPVVGYFIVRFTGGSINFINLIAVYGYSLFYLILFCMISTVPIGWLQWTLIIVSSAISGLFLKQNAKNLIKDPNIKSVSLLSLFCFLFQITLGVCIKFIFYYTKSDFVKV